MFHHPIDEFFDGIMKDILSEFYDPKDKQEFRTKGIFCVGFPIN